MTFDPNKSSAANYLAGLQAARKVVRSGGKANDISKLVDGHINRDRSKDKPVKKAAVKPPKKAGK